MIRNLFRPWGRPAVRQMPTVRRSREAAYRSAVHIVLVGIEALIRTGMRCWQPAAERDRERCRGSYDGGWHRPRLCSDGA